MTRKRWKEEGRGRDLPRNPTFELRIQTHTHTHTHRSNFNFIHSHKRTIPSARQESRSTVYCIRALVCGQVYPVVWLDLQPDCVALRRVYRVFSPLKYRNAVFGRVSRKHRCKVHPDSIIHAPIVAFCVS